MRYQKKINLGIKQLRIKHNLTQEKFAETVGITVEALRNLERNRNAPTARTIDCICQAFNIRSVDLLIEDLSDNKDIKQIIIDKLNSSSDIELSMINELIDVIRSNYVRLNPENK